MWRRVDLLWTQVSEERIASIFRVEKLASEEPVWAGGWRLSHQSKNTQLYMFFDWRLSLKPPSRAGSSLADFSTLKMEAIRSSETWVHTRSTRRHIPEDGILHSQRRENLNCNDFLLHYVDSDLSKVIEQESKLLFRRLFALLVAHLPRAASWL
jgi:hypothetical protein